jgi:serine phosphatase RsbU (regulator of sigma subunit)
MELVQDREEAIRQINELNDLIWVNRGSGIMLDNPVVRVQEAYNRSRELDYRYGTGRSALSLGMGAFLMLHDYAQAFKYINEAIDIFRELDDKKWYANSMLTMAIISTSAGQPERGLYFALRGIEYYEKNTDDEKDVVMAYYVTGTAYKDLKKFDEAEKYYKKGITYNEHGTTWSGRIFTSLSNVYNDRGNYEEALELAFKSLCILENEQNHIGVSRVYTDIGNIYKKLGKYEKALDYLFRGLKIREETNLRQFVLGSLLEISEVYLEQKDYEEAINRLQQALPIAIETAHQARLNIVYQKLAELYKTTRQFENAISYYEKSLHLTAEINQKERDAKISVMQNNLLQEKEQEIERLKNVELKNAYNLISEKNKEITDSIQYAKRIQKALLATDESLKANLPEYFILYKPKDIVSGDFYWATSVHSNQKTVDSDELPTVPSDCELFYLAVCDSTGHGVPGAFMSLLNITFLNEAINQKDIAEPHEIFNHVRERLISTVSQDGGKDGMDGILVCMEKTAKGKNMRIHYAAANNSPVLISGNKTEILSHDKMPVGKGEKYESFAMHSFDMKPGDTLYLFTDGFADQFGGNKGKKFKHKKLVELLTEISSLSCAQQKQALDKAFEDWKGDLEQVDDVCVIGIRL